MRASRRTRLVVIGSVIVSVIVVATLGLYWLRVSNGSMRHPFPGSLPECPGVGEEIAGLGVGTVDRWHNAWCRSVAGFPVYFDVEGETQSCHFAYRVLIYQGGLFDPGGGNWACIGHSL